MRIDLSPLFDGRKSTMEVEYSYTPDDKGVLLPDEIKLREPIHVRCIVTDKNGYMTLIASATALYDTVCARCLEPISTSATFSVSRLIETGADRHAQDYEHDEDYEDELLTLDGCFVEIDNDITEALSLELPMYHLCREDCPGLCPKCGKKLSEGDCGCAGKKEIDPRLAILQKLLENP